MNAYLLLIAIRFSLGCIYDHPTLYTCGYSSRDERKRVPRTWKYQGGSGQREKRWIRETSEFWPRWIRIPHFPQTFEDSARAGFDHVAETPTTTPVNAIEQFANCAPRNYSLRQTHTKKGKSLSGLDSLSKGFRRARYYTTSTTSAQILPYERDNQLLYQEIINSKEGRLIPECDDGRWKFLKICVGRRDEDRLSFRRPQTALRQN